MNDRDKLEQDARAAARAVYVGNDTLLATVLGGRLKMFLPASDIGIMPHLALDGFWESWVTCAMLRMVRPGMRVVNVGANVGYYALLFAHLVGDKGRVVAVEPNHALCAMIDKSKHANGYDQLSILRFAAADAPGDSTMVIPEGHAMNAHLGDVDGAAGRVEATFVSTVDIIVTSMLQGPADVVFIDAEGAEERIWDGMKGARLHRDVAIVIEYSPRRYKDALGFAMKFEEDGFALGYVGTEGQIVPSTPEQLAKGPEVMAVLRRPR